GAACDRPVLRGRLDPGPHRGRARPVPDPRLPGPGPRPGAAPRQSVNGPVNGNRPWLDRGPVGRCPGVQDDDRSHHDGAGTSDDDRQPDDAGGQGTLADEEGVPSPLPPRVSGSPRQPLDLRSGPSTPSPSPPSRPPPG